MFKILPQSQRIKICKYVELVIYNRGSQIISNRDKNHNLYIVLTGKVLINYPGKHTIIIDTFKLFGYTEPFSAQISDRMNAIALEEVHLIMIPREKSEKILKNHILHIEKIKLLAFIEKSVPGGHFISESGKVKLLDNFEEIEFKPGEYLVKEGEVIDSCYIIREGECKQVRQHTGKTFN